MSGAVLRVEGARELRATLRKAGADLGELSAAHKAAASLVAAAAVIGAPRRTGALAASIRPGATRTQAIVRVGGARVPYANPIHWGWGRHHIAANPWVSRAAVATEPTWAAVYRTEVARILDKVRGA